MSRRTSLPAWAKGPFTAEPSLDWQQEFLAHVRKTGQPETFPDIERHPPPEGSHPRILCRFDVDRNKRPDRDMVPCAMCSPFHEKCLDDLCLVWYGAEGVVRIIGPECGDGLHGGALLNAERKAFERRQRQARAESFLEKNLPMTEAWLVALEAMRPPLGEAQRLHHKLRHDQSAIAKKFRDVKNRENGVLSVSVTIERERPLDDDNDDNVGERSERIGPRGFGKGPEGVDTFTEQFGVLDGATIFASSYEPLAELDALIELASAFPQVTAVEDTFDWLCANESLELFEQIVEQMRDLQSRTVRLVEQVDSVIAFFNVSNFARLNAWGTHREAEFRLCTEIDDGVYTLEHRGRRSRLKPDLVTLALRPQLPDYAE